MFDRLRARVLRLMRVPPAPTPPLGAPDSIQIFRASRNYYKFKLIGWGFGQVGAAIGLVISFYLACFIIGSGKIVQSGVALTAQSA
jgi:hypothetical protein